MMKELKLTNKNQYGGPIWIELAEKYLSTGELGNFGFDLLEICILNTSQIMKTYMGIAENVWIVDATCNIFHKMMFAAIQICGLRDHKYKRNVTEKDGEDIMKAWSDIRKLLMKGKEDPPRSDRMTIPGYSIYQRRYQINDETDIATAIQTERRSEGEKRSESEKHR